MLLLMLQLVVAPAVAIGKKNQKREEAIGDRRDQRERRENQAKDFFQISFITTVSQRIREKGRRTQ